MPFCYNYTVISIDEIKDLPQLIDKVEAYLQTHSDETLTTILQGLKQITSKAVIEQYRDALNCEYAAQVLGCPTFDCIVSRNLLYVIPYDAEKCCFTVDLVHLSKFFASDYAWKSLHKCITEMGIYSDSCNYRIHPHIVLENQGNKFKAVLTNAKTKDFYAKFLCDKINAVRPCRIDITEWLILTIITVDGEDALFLHFEAFADNNETYRYFDLNVLKRDVQL